MTAGLAFVLYRLVKLEWLIAKSGWYLVEWVGAKQQGRA